MNVQKLNELIFIGNTFFRKTRLGVDTTFMLLTQSLFFLILNNFLFGELLLSMMISKNGMRIL